MVGKPQTAKPLAIVFQNFLKIAFVYRSKTFLVKENCSDLQQKTKSKNELLLIHEYIRCKTLQELLFLNKKF